MSIKFAIALFALMAAVCCNAAVVPEATATVKSLESARPDFDPTPQYSFSYDVSDSKTGDTKAQSETRTGDVVKGSYSVVEPDGTRRTVYYVASPENGFQAVIRRDSPLEAVAAAAAAQRTSVLNN